MDLESTIWIKKEEIVEACTNEAGTIVDAALGAEEMVQQLVDAKMNLEEKVKELQEAVADLEELQDMNEQLQENSREVEVELREELDLARAATREAIREKKAAFETIADREQTIIKFRELVKRQHEQCLELQQRLERESSKPVTAMPEILDFKDLKDPLHIGEPCFHVKQEHELKHAVDGSENNVVISTGYESDSKCFNQNSGKDCCISSEETVQQEVTPSNLKMSAGKSTCFTKFGFHTQQEEAVFSLFGTRLKCCLKEEEFHKFSCCFCLNIFPSKYQLIMHVFIHIDSIQPPTYVCKSCGEVFPSQISLNKHLKLNGDVKASFDQCNNKIDSIYNHENIIVESDPQVSFTEETGMQASDKETRKISRKFLNDVHNTPIITDGAEKGDTRYNHGSASTSDNFSDNAVVRTLKRLYKCDSCDKVFKKLPYLKAHVLTHTGVRKYTCDTCGKTFKLLSYIRRHVLIHRESKHKCDICGKYFAHLHTMKIHSLIHTGVKPHVCGICGKSYVFKSGLKLHALTHTVRNLQTCDICGKSFTLPCSLKRHELIHTGIKRRKCDICGKSFSRLNNVKRHALIHTGSKPHKCEICGKSFSRLEHMKRHEKKHTASKTH